MSSQNLILYDLPSRPRPHIHSWSANAWKTRLVLNYKSIPYTTTFVHLHALQSTLAQTGVAPHPKPNGTDYTVPTIRFPDGSLLSESARLAVKLEEFYPEPSLGLDPDLEKEAMDVAMVAFMPFVPAYFMPRLWRDVVAEDDRDWFHRDRSRRFGMKLEDMEGQGVEENAIEKAQPGLDAMVKLLSKYKKDEGSFLMGSRACYADLILVAVLHCFMTVGRGGYEKVVAPRRELRDLYEACGQWLKKDD